MNPADARVLTRHGSPIHYWLSGRADAPLVVLTHGAGADHRMFDAQLPMLEPSYRVLTWDVRGHGDSRPLGSDFSIRDAAFDLLAILDEIGQERAILIGQSMGGNIAQEVTFVRPDRVAALVVVGSSCNTLPPSRVERVLLAMTPAILAAYPWSMLKRQSARASSVRPEVRAYLEGTFDVVGRSDFNRILLATTRCIRDEPGYCIEQPVLICHGAHDGTGNIRSVAPRWAARDPRARLVVIPDAGHCANQDNPEFFNGLLGAFLSDVLAGPDR